MRLATLNLILVVVFLVWDFKFSRSSKIISKLKFAEPEIYATIFGRSVLPPSTIIGAIIGQGIYTKVRTQEIKDEILAINENKQKYIFWPWALFSGYIFLCLVIRGLYAA